VYNVRVKTITMVLAIIGATQARAGDMSPQKMVKFARLSAAASTFEIANLASEKCGVSIDSEGVDATAEEEGITDEVAASETSRFLENYQRADAVMRYLKSPVEWCGRIWHLLGPDHPPIFKHALLRK
jgi:hypothetical protein